MPEKKLTREGFTAELHNLLQRKAKIERVDYLEAVRRLRAERPEWFRLAYSPTHSERMMWAKREREARQ